MKKERLKLIDVIRGIVLINMIAYHALWDIVYLYDTKLNWYMGEQGYVWQQGICWLFFLISGFCVHLGKKPLKRGIMVFGAGTLVTIMTILFMPENRVVFGVLTCLGSCMILVALCKSRLEKIPPILGLVCASFLFYMFQNVNYGFLQISNLRINLPDSWYSGILATWVGFMPQDFFSTDYFSLVPWIFLYLCGYYFYPFLEQSKHILATLKKGCKPFEFLGRHSLIIYLIHQPLIYVGLYLDMWCDHQLLFNQLFG